MRTRQPYGGAVQIEPCAGGVVFDGAGRLLLIRRTNPPAAGTWSLPGGRCRAGESAADACVREVAEETGLAVRPLRSAGCVQRHGTAGTRYDIEDFVCEVLGGRLRAGDDAAGARWVSAAELSKLTLAPLLYEWLAEHDLLPR
jgi:ADP-ribose pyrophosphatase YjhB (NUDIX family)